MKGAELLVKTLEENDVKYIFGVPGDIENELFKALKDSSIDFFNVRHEQSGAFMADVYNRLTGDIGVCFSTLGPGATNMLTGIANAHQDRSAVLALSGQLPITRQRKDAHQYIDTVALYRPVTKDALMILRARDINADISRAIYFAQEERKGPVHITIPINILEEDATGYRTIKRQREESFHYKGQLGELYKLLKNSESTVAIIGNGAIRANAQKQLLNFLERYNIPAYTSFQGKGALPENHHLNCGVLSRHSKIAREVLKKQSLVITIGYDIIEGVEPDTWEGPAKVVHIDKTTPTIGCNPDLEVIGETSVILEELINEYKPVRQKNKDIDSMKLKIIPPEGIDTLYPLHPAKVMHDINKSIDDAILLSDVGLHKQFVGLYANGQDNVIFSNGLSSMGFAVPGAIAAKLACPDKNVIAVCGDGGFQMNIQELATAVENDLNIVYLVMNDGAYGMVKDKQLKTVGTTYGAEFKGKIDFVGLAESYGAKGFRVEDPGTLDIILKKALASNKVCVIDVPIQQYSDIEVMK